MRSIPNIVHANKIAVVGAGFSGAVVARELAAHLDKPIIVFDERNHIGGNCHTERDDQTGIMLHKYGPHIFHTNRKDVWDYVNSFGEFNAFTNRVKACTGRGVFSLPINLLTINQFFGKAFNPREARDFVQSLADQSIKEPQNFEEQALKFVGRELYETFFYGYTRKHWGCDPREIPASVLARLPVRFNYDDNYYDSVYQGIPRDGYTNIVSNILRHPNIEVKLGERFNREQAGEFAHVVFTGPIDAWFDHAFGRLGYRTVTFERIDAEGDYQGNAVINYPELSVPCTRIHEHKHFAPWEAHDKTVSFAEFSKATEPDDVPYYPIRAANDKALLERYRELARNEKGVSFLGRLATYRYLDMDKVIAEALDLAPAFLKAFSGPRVQFPTSHPAFEHNLLIHELIPFKSDL